MTSMVHCGSLRQRYTMPSILAISVCSIRAVSRASCVSPPLRTIKAGLNSVAIKDPERMGMRGFCKAGTWARAVCITDFAMHHRCALRARRSTNKRQVLRIPSAHAQYPCLVALPVAILLGGPLVVLLLALGKADADLGAPGLPVQLQRYQCVTGAFDGTHQPV